MHLSFKCNLLAYLVYDQYRLETDKRCFFSEMRLTLSLSERLLRIAICSVQ